MGGAARYAPPCGGGEVRKLNAAELCNAFMWLAVLAAAVILLWGSSEVWMMVVVLLAGASGSMIVISNATRQSG
jgi:hypothetical protein